MARTSNVGPDGESLSSITRLDHSSSTTMFTVVTKEWGVKGRRDQGFAD